MIIINHNLMNEDTDSRVDSAIHKWLPTILNKWVEIGNKPIYDKIDLLNNYLRREQSKWLPSDLCNWVDVTCIGKNIDKDQPDVGWMYRLVEGVYDYDC